MTQGQPFTLDAMNQNVIEQSTLIISSFYKLTGRSLINPQLSVVDQCKALLDAPFCVLSHGTETDPIFNYGNHAALSLFELDWQAFTALSSRYSAEPQNRDERKALLDEVSQKGFIENYRGVRISSTGRRFLIEDSVVWNLINDKQQNCGQAAMLLQWTEL